MRDIYRAYWKRMIHFGPCQLSGLKEEWSELCAEVPFSKAWYSELCDVLHTCLRMVHPRLGVLVWPVVVKHALREKGVLKHRR